MNFTYFPFVLNTHMQCKVSPISSTITDQITTVQLTTNRNGVQNFLKKISIQTGIFALDLTTVSLTFLYFFEETVLLLN
jgi:hypothetical protein